MRLKLTQKPSSPTPWAAERGCGRLAAYLTATPWLAEAMSALSWREAGYALAYAEGERPSPRQAWLALIPDIGFSPRAIRPVLDMADARAAANLATLSPRAIAALIDAGTRHSRGDGKPPAPASLPFTRWHVAAERCAGDLPALAARWAALETAKILPAAWSTRLRALLAAWCMGPALPSKPPLAWPLPEASREPALIVTAWEKRAAQLLALHDKLEKTLDRARRRWATGDLVAFLAAHPVFTAGLLAQHLGITEVATRRWLEMLGDARLLRRQVFRGRLSVYTMVELVALSWL